MFLLFKTNYLIVMGLIEKQKVLDAYNRIKDHISLTPLITSHIINNATGHNFYFKMDSLQKTGAFKVRGVLNHLLYLKEQNSLPKKVVCYSTGNHALGLAWSARLLNIIARIYLPKNTASIKQRIARDYGAEVIITSTRKEAEERAFEDSQKEYYFLHPSDHDLTIAGAGTLCYEALTQREVKFDAIFASCGGGGLLSGSYLAKELFDPKIKLFGTEPEEASDAFLSIKQQSISRFQTSPNTIADGLRTLGVSERTFQYLQKLDDFFTVKEEAIKYWTFWLLHLLKIIVEPSSAINMDPALRWSSTIKKPQNILILISGGNIDPVELSKIAGQNLWDLSFKV